MLFHVLTLPNLHRHHQEVRRGDGVSNDELLECGRCEGRAIRSKVENKKLCTECDYIEAIEEQIK